MSKKSNILQAVSKTEEEIEKRINYCKGFCTENNKFTVKCEITKIEKIHDYFCIWCMCKDFIKEYPKIAILSFDFYIQKEKLEGFTINDIVTITAHLPSVDDLKGMAFSVGFPEIYFVKMEKVSE